MLAADGVEAVARGDFMLVPGEFHLSTNTLRASFFAKSPAEVKPFFVDFESPALVGLFCRAARGLGEGGELSRRCCLGRGRCGWRTVGASATPGELRLVALDLAS